MNNTEVQEGGAIFYTSVEEYISKKDVDDIDDYYINSGDEEEDIPRGSQSKEMKYQCPPETKPFDVEHPGVALEELSEYVTLRRKTTDDSTFSEHHLETPLSQPAARPPPLSPVAFATTLFFLVTVLVPRMS
ncbi:hypothetical protein PTMSG1_05326 [Pyrenophora teres f. maculata]|nr:hypothetical protein PTMSG1_05326 [Pyrenophora teres f. maculata]